MRGVTLTGSAPAGKVVGAKAGEALKKTVLELGSNDAYIVLEDADLEKAVKQCVMGRIYNNGETCVAAKRFIVVDAVFDKFRDAFVAAMKNIKYGDPTGKDADIGPMAREDLRDDLHKQVEDSVKNGAKILCGGEKPEKATELADKHFDTGMVFINGFALAQPNMPFGGVKDSGFGREHGGFGMKEFVNVKAINILG